MRKPRLLILTSHPIQYQAPLFRSLAQRKELDVEVCFYSRFGVDKHVDPQFGVPVVWDTPVLSGYSHCFLGNYGLHPGPRGFWSLFNPGAISKALSADVDVIWIQGWGLATNWLVWLSTFGSGKPLLLRGESNGLDEPKGWKRLVKRTLLQMFFSRVRGFLSIGRLNDRFYRNCRVQPERIFSVPYAVDNSYFIGQSDALMGRKKGARIEAGISPEFPVILYTGKLIPKKRPLDLIEAFASAQTATPSSLVLVGDGELRRSLEHYVSSHAIPRVHFVGFRNQSEIGRFYALADVFVLPSDSEPWGLSVNEALCFGLPAIVSDRVGSGADLVRPGVNGFIYPTGDVAALSGFIAEVFSSRTRLADMGGESRRIIEQWGIDRSVNGIVRAVQAAVGIEPAPCASLEAA